MPESVELPPPSRTQRKGSTPGTGEASHSQVQAGTIVGVVGAGIMGTGVAQCLAERLERVVLVDVSREACNGATAIIFNNLRLARMLSKRKSDLSPEEVVGRIHITTDYEALADAEIVVENVTETWEAKQDAYGRLARVCPAQSTFVANTSCIPITRIATLARRPENVVGAHFMNPAFLKPAVEVIRGYHTSDSTLARCQALLALVDKKAIVVKDGPGFVSNRLSHLFMNEAIWVVQDGVADPATVDAIFKECYGHPLGPLATADLIGLDTVLNSLRVLYDSYGDPKFRPAPLLMNMVYAGRHGRKSGAGFFDY
jgi:3-hydroxybutyryl-CoA dehydrogenase